MRLSIASRGGGVPKDSTFAVVGAEVALDLFGLVLVVVVDVVVVVVGRVVVVYTRMPKKGRCAAEMYSIEY